MMGVLMALGWLLLTLLKIAGVLLLILLVLLALVLLCPLCEPIYAYFSSLRVVGDNSSLEIFLNGGATVFSTRYYPAPGDVSIKLTGAACELCNL